MKQKKSAALSPLQAMAQLDLATNHTSSETAEETIRSVEQDNRSAKIQYISPDKIKNWIHHDRPETELGDISALAKEFLDPAIGQQQPCIVRELKDDPKYAYEVIAGERRWRAAKLADVKLAVIVKKLDNSMAAMCQIAENLNRKNLSDYAIGLSYARLIESDLLKQKDFHEKFGISPVQVNRFLAFTQLDELIIESLGDMSNISARTAAEIRSLSKKGVEYKDAIITLAQKIASGKLGARNLATAVNAILFKDKKSAARTQEAEEIRSKKGLHLFTWRKDSNKNLSISFPKDIRKHLNKQKIETILRDEIETQFTNTN